MKKFILFARVGLLFSLLFLQPAIDARPQLVNPPDYPNYVVIGAFAIEKNAVKFTKDANVMNHHAQFDLNPNRNLYYVYVLSTVDKSQAIAEALRLRKETRYDDAWVYNGAIGKGSEDHPPGTDINPVTEKPLAEVAPQEQAEIPAETEAQRDSTITEAPPVVTQEAKPKLTETTLTEEEVAGKNFVFTMYRAVDGKVVEGEVEVIDTEKSRKMASYKGNVPVKVSAPAGKTGAVSFVCEAFGYRKVQTEFNFRNAEQNVTVDEAGNIVIPFELFRLQKGDIAVMYNVFFFKDAGIMRPESRFEVNSLLEMLKENPGYKIRIHGHTNGNASGKIISMGESKNFFALTDTKDGYGSAKKLSQERASAIRDYLVTNGIEESRMQIKAWGGKRPLHDKHATRAQENVRVEVEILSN
jgi:outer membrane protein OmpA-like peptidoglycan-associated protein